MKNKILIITAAMFFTTTVFAGRESGGGFAVVCRNTKGKIQSAELLDLYEARTKFHFNLVDSVNDLDQDELTIQKNRLRVMGFNSEVIELEASSPMRAPSVTRLFDKIVFLPKNFKVPSIEDLGEHSAPPTGCIIEQAALYDDHNDKIQISSEIWNEFDTLNQLALLHHEEDYHSNRKITNDQTSEKTRANIAAYFSKDSPSVVDSKLRNSSSLAFFQDNNAEIYYQENNGILTLSLAYINKALFYTSTTATFDISNLRFTEGIDSNNRLAIYAYVPNPIILRSHVKSLFYKNLVMEIDITAGKPVSARIYENDKLILDAIFSHFYTNVF